MVRQSIYNKRQSQDQETTTLTLFRALNPTEKAICVSLIEPGGDGHKKVWLPKSLIEYETFGNDQYRVEIPRWLAEREKLV